LRIQRVGVGLVRDMNLSSVMRHIHREGSLSRAQLAHRTHLNKATISSLVEELIELGLIQESGMDTSGFGRPTTMLDLNPGFSFRLRCQCDGRRSARSSGDFIKT
jgi:hypothetical protein